jgi:tetratricopeptide (TPR) repeat protein
MVRRLTGRPTWLLFFAALAVLAVAAPAAAQARIQGVVQDEKGQPIENAVVKIDKTDPGRTVHFEAKTNRKGEFIQVGLPSGSYRAIAEKDSLGSAPFTFTVRQTSAINTTLTLNQAAAAVAAQAAALNKVFQEGVALLEAGNKAGAIEKFEAAAQSSPTCNTCYDNIGTIYVQDKEYDKAEVAFKKAIEINANDADAYNGLASVYNGQRKFEEAANASKKAAELSGGLAGAGGGNADSLYNQGVALFNGGKSAEAKGLFEQAIAANPNHADAHYMHGMTLVAENPSAARAEFEKYLELAPTGKNADNAKLFASQLPK